MDDKYIGNLILFAGNFIPKNCFACDGSMIPIAGNQALFALIGTQYGGNGTTNFALPDLRGRAPISLGQSLFGTSYGLGNTGGVENVTLQTNELPPHNHVATLPNNLLKVNNITINAGTDTSKATDTPTGNYWGIAPDISLSQVKSYTNESNASMSPVAVAPFNLPSINGNVSLNNTGSSDSHENRPPFLTLKWLIVHTGLFPSRQ